MVPTDQSRPGEPRVTLEPVEFNRHESLLARWLRHPHVVRWWGDPESRFDQLSRTPEAEHALISVSRCPVGYIRWQTVERTDLEAVGLSDIPDGAIDIDLFIGESSWLGRGVGSAALRLLLERLRSEEKAPLAGLCTSINNAAAIRASERAGFRKLRQYDDPTYGRCWVLVADLTDPPRHVGSIAL